MQPLRRVAPPPSLPPPPTLGAVTPSSLPRPPPNLAVRRTLPGHKQNVSGVKSIPFSANHAFAFCSELNPVVVAPAWGGKGGGGPSGCTFHTLGGFRISASNGLPPKVTLRA